MCIRDRLRTIRFRQRAHLLPEVADQAAALVIVPGHPGLRIGDESAQAVERGVRRVGKKTFQFASKVGAIRIDQGGAESFLAVEVMIEGPLGNADAAPGSAILAMLPDTGEMCIRDRSVRFVTAHCKASLDTLDWPALAAERQTLSLIHI